MAQTEDPKELRSGGRYVMPSEMLCTEKTRAGDLCPTVKMKDSDYCFWHDPRPEIEQRRNDARDKAKLTAGRKKNYVKGIGIPIENVNEVRVLLEETIANLREMTQTVPVCNALVRALQAYHAILTDTDVIEKVLGEIAEIRDAMKLND